MPRPTKLTPAIHKAIVLEITEGQYAKNAAALSGVSESAFYGWIRRGEAEVERLDAGLTDEQRVEAGAPAAKDEARYVQFLVSVKGAEAQAERDSVRAVRRAANDSWQAAAWYLERKFKDRWGRSADVTLAGPGGGPVEVRTVSDEDLARAAAELAALVALPGVDAGDTGEPDNPPTD